jgi:RNA polymerase sigma-70 factor (ECF subfamily)
MANADPSTSASLLIRGRDPNDSDAWRLFVEVYGPLIESFCRRRGLQAADAADVGQNVIVRVSQAIRGFEYRVERGRFRAWLGAVIRNELRRHWAKESRQPQTVTSDERGDFEQLAIEAESDPEWRDAFSLHIVRIACDRIRESFESSSWAAFEATWFRQEDPARVAAQLNLTLRAVYVAKSRIAQRLRQEILLLADDVPLLPS